MGWWGPGVFDGDSALDRYRALSDNVGLGLLIPDASDLPGPPTAALPPYWTDQQARTVGGHPETVAAVAAWGCRQDPHDADGCYGVQVAAATLLAAGAPVADPLAALAALACDLDPWAARNPARRHSIDQFRSALALHDGRTPVRIDGRSIDEAFACAAAHHSRVVNLPGATPPG